MVHPRVTNLDLEIPRGLLPGHTSVAKFGRNSNLDSGIPTDIWNLITQPIWLPPTQARLHTIVSTSGNDAAAGTGARTIAVSGLTDWDTAETVELVTMTGVAGVTTDNAYVIIHRMAVVTAGASGPNVGVITATAQTDATVTAQIDAGAGQTQMAIYGIPSVQTAFMPSYGASFNKSGGAAGAIDLTLLVNPIPGSSLASFLVKSTHGLVSTATSHMQHRYCPYFTIPGPAIIKMQGVASAADLDCSADFDLILVDNKITSS
jgi:hypothetical protein